MKNFLRIILPPMPVINMLLTVIFSESGISWFVFTNFKYHYLNIVIHGFIYTCLCCYHWLASAARTLSTKWALIVLVVAVVFAYWLLRNETFPLGKTYLLISIWAETFFFESMCEERARCGTQCIAAVWKNNDTGSKAAFTGLSLFIMLLAIRKRAERVVSFVGNAQVQFFLPWPYFIRSCCWVLILFRSLQHSLYCNKPVANGLFKTALLRQNCMGIATDVAVGVGFGVWYTRLPELEPKRWEAYNYLIKQEMVSPDKINAGWTQLLERW